MLADQDEKKMVCTNIKAVKNCIEWHGRVCNISEDRYGELSNITEDVPYFRSTVIESPTCVPRVTAKMHKAHI